MVPNERLEIEGFLQGKLVEFVNSLPTTGLNQDTKRIQKLADEVNAELLKKFECLDDYKIITLITSLFPEQKAGGLCNAALWSDETDTVISSEYTRDSLLYSISTHFIKISGEESSGTESD